MRRWPDRSRSMASMFLSPYRPSRRGTTVVLVLTWLRGSEYRPMLQMAPAFGGFNQRACSFSTLSHCPSRHSIAVAELCLSWRAFAFLFGLLSTRACSTCSPVLFLPRRNCLRLLLSCACPPLCDGAAADALLGLA